MWMELSVLRGVVYLFKRVKLSVLLGVTCFKWVKLSVLRGVVYLFKWVELSVLCGVVYLC